MSVSYGMPSPPQACGTRYVVALRLCFTKININLRKRDILHVKKSKTHNIMVSHTIFTVTMDKITIQSRRFYRPVKAFRHQEKRIQATEKGVPCRKRPAVHGSHRTVTEMVLSPLTRKKKAVRHRVTIFIITFVQLTGPPQTAERTIRHLNNRP